MRKGRETIGLPVVSLKSGKELGFVEDLVWSHQERRVSHLIVRDKGLTRKEYLVDLSSVASVGDDAVTVTGEDSLSEVSKPADGYARLGSLTGLPAMTTGGNNLGTIEDLVFALNEGRLLGYELSAGLVGDLVSGRELLEPEKILTWGEDAVIVNEL